MRRLRKVIAVLLVAVVFFAAVPLKSNNNTVLADVTYVDREQKVPNFMDGIYQFLDRLYYIALGRTTDPDGRFNWFNHIIYDGYTGADLVRGILFSPEFLNKNCSNEEFVSILYQVILDRNADEGGMNTWTAALRDGQSRQSVIEGFLGSVEWSNLCLIYGIPAGNNAEPSIAILPTGRSKSFVQWLHNDVFARMPGDDAVEIYASQLVNFDISCTQLAHDFFFSPEINALSNYDFLVRLYRCVLNREPTGDFQGCLDMLNNGTLTREQIFTMAAESNEWAQTCGGFYLLR
ncbi:MAG: DUF4214 domain-containing protein [Clostridiales bacterium]|nr:DUF4214 domain-containing protein [Clostridiales bacterium]